MQRRITFIIIAVVICLQSKAQFDYVSIKANYSHQSYYNLTTGKSITVPNDAWDIAFSNAGLQDAGVLCNESTTLNGTPLKVFLAKTTVWSEAITDTTFFVDSTMLLNPKKNWTEGAFNTLKSSTSPFDYGWGAYNQATNTVVGSRIFVIKKRDGSFIKFQIVQLVLNDYTFKYANLDGSNEVTKVISKDKTSPNRLLHFSFESGKVEMPSDYDLVFQRYKTPVPVGDGTTLDYNVTGVLLAPGVEAVVADGIDPKSISEKDYETKYSKNISIIGYDWKTFDMNSGWSIDDNRSHYIKTKKGDKYQITFIDYEGNSTGITTLEKKLIFTSAVSNTINDSSITIYPNPSADYITIEGVEDKTPLSIVDRLGRVVLNTEVNKSNNKIGLNTLPTGNYQIQLSTKGGLVSKQCTKL